MKKISLIIAGIALILIGLVGWLIPILPGWPFVFVGLSLIAPTFARKIRHRIFRKFKKESIYFIEEWKKFSVEAGFTTRHFPLTLHNSHEFLDASNQHKFLNLINDKRHGKYFKTKPDKFIVLEQIHGEEVAVLDDKSFYREPGFYSVKGTDGVVTCVNDLTLLVLTADCLPLFFYVQNSGKKWIGAVHAGWRGTQKKISQKALSLIKDQSGCAASDVQVILGARIGKTHY